jgi:hypothetical protein
MDKELKESCYDIYIKTDCRQYRNMKESNLFSNLYKNMQNSVFVSYRHTVIRESKVHIIHLPVIKSEGEILQQLN